MLRQLESLFDTDAPGRGNGLLRLIISDYLAYYGPTTRMRRRWGVGGSRRNDSPRKLALLFIPRLAHNPCLHATVLLRLATRSPKVTLGLWRTVLIAKHSIDISRNIEIGPGLLLPHPVGISLGASVRIGRDVTLMHNVGLGGNVFVGSRYRPAAAGVQLAPSVGDDVVIFTDSILVGAIHIGDRAVIGAGAWVDEDVPPRKVHPGRAALFRALGAGP